MKINILEQETNLVKIEIDQRDMTLLHPLVEELLKDKTVVSAQYILGHPELDKPVLRVQVSSGKPTTAIKRAVKSLIKTYADLRKVIEKEIK